MSTKKLMKEIAEKSERAALQKLSDQYNLQEFNVEIKNGHVHTLAIKFKNLKEIPSEIGMFTDLENLDLSHNQLEKLDGLIRVIKLHKLCLRDNTITKLEKLETLVTLRDLDCSENQIRTMEGLFNCRQLETLELSRNSISRIQDLENCQQLRVLKLNNNPITQLEGVDKLTKLETLFITHAQIHKIEGLENNTYLREINFAFNQIKKIENLEQLQLLRYLNLNDNQIEHLENLEQQTVLQEIALDRNIFSPEDIAYITKPAKEIVNYCREKSTRIKKNVAYKQGIQAKRDKYQIDEELAAQTVVQTPKETKVIREKIVAQIQQNGTLEQKNLKQKVETENKKTNEFTENPFEPEKKPVIREISNPYQKNIPKETVSPNEEKVDDSKNLPPELPKEKPKPHPKDIPVPVAHPQIENVLGQKFETEQEWQQFAEPLVLKEDYKNALKALRNVLQLNTRNLQAWIYSGIAFNNKGDYRRAIGALKQGLAINTKNFEAWLYLGIANYNSGEFEEAVKALNEVLRIDPNNEITQQYLAQIPPEYKQNLDLLDRQAEILAQTSAQVEGRLLQQLEHYTKAYAEMKFEELLPLVQNPPHITNEATLKQMLTDLILEGRLKAKLFIDHIQFIQGELEEKFRKKVNIDERFMVQKLLAFTNFSKLWLADDLQTKQQSVLKMILMKGELTKAKLAEQMALREIALISRVTSPNVVTLLNAFEAEYQEETGYVLQIPYYEHGTLDKRIKEFKANFERTGELFSAKSILGIFIGLLRAIVSVHEAGIIHRDIKPANIIINTASREAAPQDVILIDFGIATAPFDISGMDFTIAGAGTGVGTFGFSAPEQLQSGKVDYSADMYAIGATMYYTMTLNKFPGEFYLPDYANTKYQSISFIYPILQRMLNLAPDERESKTEDIRAIVMQLIKEYKNM